MPEEPGSMTIGEVLTELSPDFPDVSISKIRFLEGEGLITPSRAPSGYRRFTRHDVETLRLILTAQRDRYLPLRVIKDHLRDDSLRAHLGLVTRPDAEPRSSPEPEVEVLAEVTVDESAVDVDRHERFTRRDVAAQSGLPLDAVDELAKAGVIQTDPAGKYSGADVLVCRAFATLSARGVESRHMTQVRLLADRNVGMVTTALSHLEGSERDQSVEMMFRAMTDALYWQMVAGISRESPPTGYRPRRPKAR